MNAVVECFSAQARQPELVATSISRVPGCGGIPQHFVRWPATLQRERAMVGYALGETKTYNEDVL